MGIELKNVEPGEISNALGDLINSWAQSKEPITIFAGGDVVRHLFDEYLNDALCGLHCVPRYYGSPNTDGYRLEFRGVPIITPPEFPRDVLVVDSGSNVKTYLMSDWDILVVQSDEDDLVDLGSKGLAQILRQ